MFVIHSNGISVFLEISVSENIKKSLLLHLSLPLSLKRTYQNYTHRTSHRHVLNAQLSRGPVWDQHCTHLTHIILHLAMSTLTRWGLGSGGLVWEAPCLPRLRSGEGQRRLNTKACQRRAPGVAAPHLSPDNTILCWRCPECLQCF